MREPLVFLDGEILPRARARIPVGDHSFRYGEGVFETLRARGRRAFRSARHLARLRRSAGLLRWELPWTDDAMRRALEQTLQANGHREARVRIQAGPGEPGAHPVLLVEAVAFVPVEEKLRTAGVALGTWPHRRPREGGFLSGAKATAYVENLVARSVARQAGAHDALFLDQDGRVCEASSANLFLVSDGVLRTPPASSGILEGVTREVLLEVMAVREQELTLEQALAADELFLTSTGVEVLPVTSLDGVPVGDGKPGPVTREAARRYRELLDRELPHVP